jgi:hypothetical protein
MSRLITALLLLTMCAMNTIAQPESEKISIEVTDAPLGQVLREIGEEAGISVYFRDEWLNDVVVSLKADSADAISVIRRAIGQTGLNAEQVAGRGIFILTERGLKKDLSFSDGKSGTNEDEAETEDATIKRASSYLSGTRPEQIMRSITVGSESSKSYRGTARIMGRIADVETGYPISGATMIILETGKGTVSDKDGLLIMALKPGTYTARFSYIGKEQINCRLEVLSGGKFDISMSSSLIAIDEVQIQAKQYRKINTTDVGIIHLSMKSLKQLPVFMGEKDVIKIAKLLPGITSAGEASSGVNVRGGSADQNIFYINRIPVYNTSHLFGFFSAFNSEIIRDYSIYKGNVPVNFGGRLSSVFDIVTRQGNKKRYTASGSISPVFGKLTFEGPLISEKASFIVSGRTTYSDWILGRLEDPLIRQSSAGFYDLSGSVSTDINETNKITGFYYQSYDHFKYSHLSDYGYANHGGSIQWNSQVSSAIKSEVTAAVSGFTFDYINRQEASKAYRHAYSIMHNEVNATFNWVPALNHKVEFGGGMILYNLNRGIVAPFGENSLRNPVDLGSERSLEGSLFVSDNINFTDRLSVYAGLRYSAYANLGPEEIRLYEEGSPREDIHVTGTKEFNANEIVAFYSGPEFRTAANYKFDQNTSFKLSFSQMRQYLLMMTNTVSVSPTDQWKLTDYYIRPPVSYQYSGGVHHIFPKPGVSVSLEIYYKDADLVPDFRDGASFISSPYVESEILQGTLNAYGAELLVERSGGKLNGWISYTLSRSVMHVEGPSASQSINHGLPYPSNYDRPHVLNLVGNYKFSRRVTLASNIVYMTGRPVTYPSSLYYMDGVAYMDYYSRNQSRVPDYFRIDLSLSLEGNLKSEKNFHSSWNINVYNLLGRNNPQSLFFEPNEYFIKGYSFSVIGSPIITVTWNIKLGNYETQ